MNVGQSDTDLIDRPEGKPLVFNGIEFLVENLSTFAFGLNVHHTDDIVTGSRLQHDIAMHIHHAPVTSSNEIDRISPHMAQDPLSSIWVRKCDETGIWSIRYPQHYQSRSPLHFQLFPCANEKTHVFR